MVRGRDFEHHEFVNQLEIKNRVSDEINVKAQATQKDFELRCQYSPSFLNQNGLDTNVELEGKYTPYRDKYEVKAGFKFKGLKIGGATPWSEVSI